MNRQTLPRLGILSLWNYPLFNPRATSHFGGWEVQVAYVAKELAKRGAFEVRMVVGDHGQPHVEKRHGVTLYSWQNRPTWGISTKDLQPTVLDRFQGFRRKPSIHTASPALDWMIGSHPVDPRLVSICDEVDADVYMVPGNSELSAQATYYCRQRGRKHIFLAGSDADYDPQYKSRPDATDVYDIPYVIKVFAIENSHLHIVQSERQAEMLRTGYGRSSTLIKNPIDLERRFPRATAPQTVLWVGASNEQVKRPSMVLELARRLPTIPFVIIMTFSFPETHAISVQAARRLGNVTLLERVPFAQVEKYYANARILLNTSTVEGFPNTFLQAAKYGVPIVSAEVDRGGMLSQHRCGFVCGGDVATMEANILNLQQDSMLYARLSQNTLHYVRAHHDREIIVPQYERAILSLL